MSKKKAKSPVYSLLLFTKERCNPCAVAKPHVARAAAALGLELEETDAVADPKNLVLAFNILSVPTLILLKDGRKLHEFSGSTVLTEKHLTDRIPKLIDKESK